MATIGHQPPLGEGDVWSSSMSSEPAIPPKVQVALRVIELWDRMSLGTPVLRKAEDIIGAYLSEGEQDA
jgi:hypothetical protein